MKTRMIERNAIVALTSDPAVSHTAWRVTRPLEALARVGVPTEVISVSSESPDGFVYRQQFEGITLSPEVSTLVLHHAIVPVAERKSFRRWITAVRKSGVTVVYDTDDDVYSRAWAEHHLACYADLHGDDLPAHPTPEVVQHERVQESAGLAWVLDEVDGITVSTPRLADVVRTFTYRTVDVVPNAIDVSAFQAGLSVGQENRLWGRRPTIGWCAGYRPEADARPVAAAWKIISQQYPGVRFVLAGYPLQCLLDAVPAEHLAHVPYTTMEQYPAGMQVDIGCCAASPTDFNRSRSPIKTWEYALAGAAVIASPTTYGAAVENGVTGLLAETADEWYRALTSLLDMPSHRRWHADELRETVLGEHPLEKNLWRWTDAYRAIRAEARGSA